MIGTYIYNKYFSFLLKKNSKTLSASAPATPRQIKILATRCPDFFGRQFAVRGIRYRRCTRGERIRNTIYCTMDYYISLNMRTAAVQKHHSGKSYDVRHADRQRDGHQQRAETLQTFRFAAIDLKREKQ